MKFLQQLGYLRLGRKGGQPLEEDGRVLHLFRNRAELKKQYSELQDEIHRLKDRIKQQEGATARVQETLDALRGRLAEAITGYPTLVFYQLRDLWNTGQELLTQFVAELVQQQEERERRQFLADFNRRQFSRRQLVEARLRETETQFADVREKLQGLEHAKAFANRWWHYFRRRELERRLQLMGIERQAADLALEEARSGFAAVEAETPGEFPGLTLEARRAINLAAIGYAEVLCLRLARTQLVALAKAAMMRRESTDEYGDQVSCVALMAEIARAKLLLQQKNNVAQEVKGRTDRIKAGACYRSAQDVVPADDSVRAPQLEAAVEGQDKALPPNVLGEDLWDIYRVMLR